tara:strand:+ start:266 stop:742 length:477 start_codon:yes stop_codon:yes gene_type:complete
MADGLHWQGKSQAFIDRQVYLQALAGIREDHAAAFAKAIAFGGVSERDAYRIICDRDCARNGELHELQDTDEIPSDRWFRDAWRRSRNGGPIGVNLELARPIQWERLQDAIERENRRRERLLTPIPPIAAAENFRAGVCHARDDEELRRVWPDGLQRI